MKILFVHPSFPCQFGQLLRALAASGRHQLVFVTHAAQFLPDPLLGVTVVPFRLPLASRRTHPDARAFEDAMRRAAAVAEVAAGLLQAGFTPNLVIGHEGWGDTLNIRDVWPGAPQIGFREYFYHEHGADVGFDPEFPVHPAALPGVRARNAPLLLALHQGHAGVSPTRWQRGLYPTWARPGIHLVEDAVDLHARRPDPSARARPFRLGSLHVQPGEHLVTFVASSLEPYRGLHTLLRATPALLARPGVHVACVGGTATRYGLPPPRGEWRDWLVAELRGRVDLSRLHWPGTVDHDSLGDLLRRSDVHAYLSYPFIASWSLREALASGCAVIAADTPPAREFVRHGHTGVLVPPLDPAATAAAILSLLDDPTRRAALGHAARAWAERHLHLAGHLARWRALIRKVSGHDPNG